MSLADATSAIVPTYARAKVAFERGEGCWLTSTNGERSLDFGAGIAVTSVGHAHPHLVEALTNQGSKLWHVSNLYQNPEGERFARRLVDATFADLVFFANSGAEANEAAIKMARRRQSVDGHPGALSHANVRRRVPWPDAGHDRGRGPSQISRRLRPQGRWLRPDSADRPQGGRGGDRAGDRLDPDRADPGRGRGCGSFRRRSCVACARSATGATLILIFDEVQTGVGRTGRFYAYEHCGIHPDILTSAKGNRRRLSDVGVSRDRGRRAGTHHRRSRHDVRRQSAGDGGRATPRSTSSSLRDSSTGSRGSAWTCASGWRSSRIGTTG